MYLSVIIPAYNEEKRIGATLSRIHSYLSARKYDFEVLVVDDGSCDDTVLEAETSRLNSEGKLKVLRNGVNRGKGYSVKNGILNSKGEYVLFSDADLSTPIEEVEKLFAAIKNGSDIAIGSRDVDASRVKVRQPRYREIMGRVFNLFVKTFLIRDFNDTQCGFKLFRGAVARDLAASLVIDGFCFDVEMLYLAVKRGYKVSELGVVWENSLLSKVKILGSSSTMFLDLLRIKAAHK